MKVLVGMFRSNGLHGYSVKFSPIQPDKLALVACQKYGIEGSGSLIILHTPPEGQCHPVQAYEWADGLFDISWSETSNTLLATAGGDGTVQVWDLKTTNVPISVYKDHQREVYSIDWGGTPSNHLLVTGSWDQTCKVWDPVRNIPNAISTFAGHSGIVYCVGWSPQIPCTFASVSGDATIRVWDARKTYMPQFVIPGHDAEVLTCDWSKYDENILVTGSVDSTLRIWDLRNTSTYLRQLSGHEYAVRRVRFSAHSPSRIVSCSYDFTIRTWDYRAAKEINPMLEVINHHTEFVYGLDCSVHVKGLIGDCAWDEITKYYLPASLVDAPPATLIQPPVQT